MEPERQFASRLVILVIKAEIQRHDSQALGIRIGHFNDVAGGDDRGDPLGIGHLAVRAAHHAMRPATVRSLLRRVGCASSSPVIAITPCADPSLI